MENFIFRSVVLHTGNQFRVLLDDSKLSDQLLFFHADSRMRAFSVAHLLGLLVVDREIIGMIPDLTLIDSSFLRILRHSKSEAADAHQKEDEGSHHKRVG
jgi:hypothetical protein